MSVRVKLEDLGLSVTVTVEPISKDLDINPVFQELVECVAIIAMLEKVYPRDTQENHPYVYRQRNLVSLN